MGQSKQQPVTSVTKAGNLADSQPAVIMALPLASLPLFFVRSQLAVEVGVGDEVALPLPPPAVGPQQLTSNFQISVFHN